MHGGEAGISRSLVPAALLILPLVVMDWAIWSWLGILLSPANAGMRKVVVPFAHTRAFFSKASQQEQVVKSVAKCVVIGIHTNHLQ